MHRIPHPPNGLADLLAQVHGRKPKAMPALVLLAYDPLRTFARSVGASEPLAEQLIHELLLDLFRGHLAPTRDDRRAWDALTSDLRRRLCGRG